MSLTRFIAQKHADAHAKRERRKEARPGELLDAALELFVEKGYTATRAEEVAARAGVSKGTLFLYFPSKEELLKAVVRENISGRFPQWMAEFEAFEGSSAEMLHFCMREWWSRVGMTKASGIAKLMMSEAGNFPDLAEFYRQEVILPSHVLIGRVLQRGIDSGEFRALDLDYAIYCVIAPMIFLMMSKHCIPASGVDGKPLEPEKYIAAQVEHLLHGICLPQGDPQA